MTGMNGTLVILKDIREFDPHVAEFIALEVAKGASVSELHEEFEDRVPSPIIVNRWRKQVPQFDLVMREAEECKAQALADQVVRIADDEDRQAAQAANAIKARQWLASKLSEQFTAVPKPTGPQVVINNGLALSDEQLMQIAAGAVPAIEGSSERKDKNSGVD